MKRKKSASESFRSTVEKRSTSSSESKAKRALKVGQKPASKLRQIGRKSYHFNETKMNQNTFLHKHRSFVPSYFQKSYEELQNVTWLKRSEALRLTASVIIFSVLFGVVVSAVDYGLDRLFKGVVLK